MIRTTVNYGRTLVLAAMLWLCAMAAAQAQAAYDDAKLEAFVTAAIKIDRMIETLIPQMQAAKSQEEAVELRQAANKDLVEVVETTEGITVEEYREINLAARSDDALFARIEKIYTRRLAQ